MSEQQNPASVQNDAPSFAIEKIYVKDLSVEVPHSPEIFLEKEGPEIEIQLGSKSRNLGADAYEVVLTTTVTARLHDKIVFLVEVGQAGIFRITNMPEDNLEPLLAVACPNILFPYNREVVANAVTQAGFTPIILQPVNFEGMYMAHLQETATQVEAGKQQKNPSV